MKLLIRIVFGMIYIFLLKYDQNFKQNLKIEIILNHFLPIKVNVIVISTFEAFIRFTVFK